MPVLRSGIELGECLFARAATLRSTRDGVGSEKKRDEWARVATTSTPSGELRTLANGLDCEVTERYQLSGGKQERERRKNDGTALV